MDRHVVHDWLRSVLGPYVDSQRTFADTVAALDSHPSLSPRTDLYVSNEGHSSLLLHLKGTLPINFRGSTYNIPVQVWIPRAYPHEAPIGYVVPTRDMLVRRTEHVELDGLIGGEYHVNWARKSETKSILAYLDACRDAFSRQPPVYTKPPIVSTIATTPSSSSASRAQATLRSVVTSSSSMTASHAQKPPPPLPPNPANSSPSLSQQPQSQPLHRPPKPCEQPAPAPAPGFGQERASSHSSPDNWPSGEPSRSLPPHSNGTIRPTSPLDGRPQHHQHSFHSYQFSFPRSPLDAAVTSRFQDDSRLSAWLNHTVRPQTYAWRPANETHGPSRSSSVSLPQGTRQRSSCLPSPGLNGAVEAGCYGEQSARGPQGPTVRQQPRLSYPLSQASQQQQVQQQQQQRPPQPPMPPSNPSMSQQSQHQHQQAQATQVSARQLLPEDLLDSLDHEAKRLWNIPTSYDGNAGSASSKFVTGHSVSTSTAPPPLRPPNPEIQSLHVALHEKITARIATLRSHLASSNSHLAVIASDLDRGPSAIEDESARLEAVRDVCHSRAEKLEAILARAKEVTQELRAREGKVDSREVVLADSIVGDQLIGLLSADLALTDLLYHMGRALGSESLDLNRYLKWVRMCGREQFLKRALAAKIQAGLDAMHPTSSIGEQHGE